MDDGVNHGLGMPDGGPPGSFAVGDRTEEQAHTGSDGNSLARPAPAVVPDDAPCEST